MSGNLAETLIGATVVAVAAVFLLFAFNRAELGGVDGYPLTARFEKIDGVKVGTDVLMSGIKIGSVTGLRLDAERFQAVVEIAIADGIELPEDSALKVTSDGLLGGKYLSIDPGGADDNLQSGDEIVHTQGAVDLTELIGKAIYSAGGSSN